MAIPTSDGVHLYCVIGRVIYNNNLSTL